MGEQLYISRTLMYEDLLIGAKPRVPTRSTVSLYKRVVEVYDSVLGGLQGGSKYESV